MIWGGAPAQTAIASAAAVGSTPSGIRVQRDTTVEVEFAAFARSDLPLEIEPLNGAAVDVAASVEVTGRTQADSGYPAEDGRRVLVDPETVLEVLCGLRTDPTLEAEFVSTVQTNGPMAVEWSGGVLVGRDNLIEAEWTAALEKDLAAGIETVAILTANQNGALEWLTTIRRDDLASGEDLVESLRDAGFPSELLSSGTIIAADSALSFESVGTPQAVLFSLEAGPNRARLLVTPGRIRLLRRN
jgi:hypothetical protein